MFVMCLRRSALSHRMYVSVCESYYVRVSLSPCLRVYLSINVYPSASLYECPRPSFERVRAFVRVWVRVGACLGVCGWVARIGWLGGWFFLLSAFLYVYACVGMHVLRYVCARVRVRDCVRGCVDGWMLVFTSVLAFTFVFVCHSAYPPRNKTIHE